MPVIVHQDKCPKNGPVIPTEHGQEITTHTQEAYTAPEPKAI